MVRRIGVMLLLVAVLGLGVVACETEADPDQDMEAADEMADADEDAEPEMEQSTDEAAPSSGAGLRGLDNDKSGAPISMEDPDSPFKPMGPKGSDRLPGACGSCAG